MGLKEQILEAADKQKSKVVPIKAWGVDCFVRVMSGTERDAWEGEIYRNGNVNHDRFRARFLVKTLADQNGNRIFSPAELDQLSGMDSVELDRIYTLSKIANGLSKADVDELTKN